MNLSYQNYTGEVRQTPSIDRLVSWEVMVGPKTTLEKPLFELICKLIKSEKVQSVSCPFQDYALWRVLVEEQVRRAESTGLPPQQALFLSGPDSGLPHIDASNWGGEAHIPYEGATEGDLFIYPSWRIFHPDLASLKAGTGGKQCYYLLIEKDYGEIECATRTVVGSWVLYESKLPYQKCKFQT